MPMCFARYESWLDDEGNPVPVREGRRVAADRSYHHRYSIPSNTTTTTTKVQIVLPPTPEPEPQIQEICYIPTYIPALAPAPDPAPFNDPTFIEVTAETIANRIVAENAARDEVVALQDRLDEETTRRFKAEHGRNRVEARRITQEIESDRRSRELIFREDDARRRIAEEYRFQSRSLGNSPRASDESLWSTTPRASSSHSSRLAVVNHHHSHRRSHSDSRTHKCSNCGHSGHRSRECHHSPEPANYRVSGRVRYIDSGL